jgi:Zn-dependent protease
LLALCFHEYCHGWVANKLGDPTAKLMGRLTMNPLAHADPLGTVVLPLAAIFMHIPFFGWAKPVPVNERNLKNKSGMFWVALAGPGSNVFLATVSALVLAAIARFGGVEAFLRARDVGSQFVIINLSLAFFNLIPIHPLDGGKIFGHFLPDQWNRKLEEMQGILSLLLLVVFLTGGLSTILFKPVIYAGEFLLVSSLKIFGVG